MPRIKLNNFYPAICEREVQKEFTYIHPVDGEVTVRKWIGCMYTHIFDSMAPASSPNSVGKICNIRRVCSAHAVSSNVINGKLWWWDGNWKDVEAYEDYQRHWFLWLGNATWKAKVAAGITPANEPMPPANAAWPVEPPRPGFGGCAIVR